jgi:hypothetical protein
MRESLKNRAAAIRHYLDRQDDLGGRPRHDLQIFGDGCGVESCPPVD